MTCRSIVMILAIFATYFAHIHATSFGIEFVSDESLGEILHVG